MALSFNSIADDVEAMSSSIHSALGVVPPPEPIPRYLAEPASVRTLEELVAHMDDLRWQALNHIAYVRMLVGVLTPVGLRGFEPSGWNYPSAPGRSFADAVQAYHVLDGDHVGTLIDVRAPPDEWPSMVALRDARIPFWWLCGPEDYQTEREHALRLRHYNNDNLPYSSAQRAAKKDCQARRRARESLAPYGGASRCFLFKDNGETVSLFRTRVQSTDPEERRNVQRMSVVQLPVAAMASGLWIRRYKFIRGYPGPTDISFLEWRPLRGRHDIEHGREADSATWSRRLRPPTGEDDADEDRWSQDSDFDSDGVEPMRFSDTRRWPAEPEFVFPRRFERPPGRTSFPTSFREASVDWVRRFSRQDPQAMDVDTPTPLPAAQESREAAPALAVPETLAPSSPHEEAPAVASPPTVPRLHPQSRAQPPGSAGVRIRSPALTNGKGKGRAADGSEETVDGFRAADIEQALGASTLSRGRQGQRSAGESSRSVLDRSQVASGSNSISVAGSSSLYSRIFPAPDSEPSAGLRTSRPALALISRIRDERSLSPRRGGVGSAHGRREESSSRRRKRSPPPTAVDPAPEAIASPPAAPATTTSSAAPSGESLLHGPWPETPPQRPLDADERWPSVSVRWPNSAVVAITRDLPKELRRISPMQDTRVVSEVPGAAALGRLALPPASALRLWWWTEQHPYREAVHFVAWAVARGVRFVWGMDGTASARLGDPLAGALAPSTLPWPEWVHDAVEVLRRPNARALIWDGGILWRLALYFRRDLVTAAMSGPSSVASVAPTLYGWPTGFVTDVFSTAEVNLLIGRRQDGLSWWPHPDVWDSVAGLGEWWNTHEEWFSARMAGILSGAASPLADGAWYGHIRNWMVSASRPIMHAGNLRRAWVLVAALEDHSYMEELSSGFVRLRLDPVEDEDMEDGEVS